MSSICDLCYKADASEKDDLKGQRMFGSLLIITGKTIKMIYDYKRQAYIVDVGCYNCEFAFSLPQANCCLTDVTCFFLNILI